MGNKKECLQCDYDNALDGGRAKWLCPECGRDYSFEYYAYKTHLQNNYNKTRYLVTKEKHGR